MGRVLKGFVVLLLALVFVPSASAAIFLSADATGEKGYVRLGILGSMNLENIHVGEFVNGNYEEISPLSFDYFGTYDGYGDLGRATLAHAARWRCDRIQRTFLAYADTPEGVREESNFVIRTPSCENRMRMSMPIKSDSDESVDVVLKDTFEIGAVGGKLCRKPPGEPARCKAFRVPTGSTKSTTTFVPPRDGYWRITLRSPGQTITKTLAVGVKPRAKDIAGLPDILATGDSLMQGLDAILEDRLAGDATVDTDVKIGTGLTKKLADLADWSKLPGQQVRKFKPEATVLFLGSNDGAPIKVGGTYVACCDQDWIDAYATIVRRTMKTYIQGGKGRIYWLAIPASSDDRRTQVISGVNHALEQASRGIKNARVLDMVALFTPGGVYREYMMYKGQRVKVRQNDGVHLTNEGADIAADYIIDEFERDGVL